MFFAKSSSLLICFTLFLIQPSDQANILSNFGGSLKNIFGKVTQRIGNVFGAVTSTFQSPMTKAMRTAKTNEFIEYYGYLAEVHNVVTEDGYILTIFRCNSKRQTFGEKKVVVLQHGFTPSSDDFVMARQSLAYVLADAGYDVWLPNSRGNFYSRKHTTLSTKQSEFWDFSYYEVGVYDYPAILNYIMNATKRSSVYVAAHSMGTTAMMILLSERPEYNNFIRAASFLAPVGYFKHPDPVLHALSRFRAVVEPFKHKELYPRRVSRSTTWFCDMGLENVCNDILDIVTGQSEHQRDKKMVPTFVAHTPSGTSVKILLHYAQAIRYGNFGKFMVDSSVTPNFELGRIRAPIMTIHSTTDRFATPQDVDYIMSMINNSMKYVHLINDTEFNHIDFLWGIDAPQLVYSKILRALSSS
ncbi:lipase 1-like, partial [Contarinia nasturtii]|uniref:lipase 1-like n=1 Tax=Contarinia nasturtii TaxID=265458 RepID=UPI0012D4AE55